VADVTDHDLPKFVETVHVFSEVDPIQKERIVRAYSEGGHTVGFLGDGINDSPALHAADVGISVDSAVDVAKQTADLVLLTKDLGVLAQGIKEGRRIFVNTLKYVHVTTSANFGNMVSLAAATAFLPFLPMLPLQVLLLNFLSDIPGLTIATDDVDEELTRRPRTWNTRHVRSFMIVFGLTSTVFDLLTFGVLRLGFGANEELLRSGWFVESTLTELAALLMLRTNRRVWASRPGPALFMSSVVTAMVTATLPFSVLASRLGLVGLPWRVALALAAITVGYIAVSEMFKVRFAHLTDQVS
jgi:Mg2+-importing ATPase